jgi:prophage regulatory protein
MSPTIPKGYDMADKYLRRRAVQDLTGLSRSTIYDLMAKSEFPRPVHLSVRAVAWPESEITAWLQSRKARREAA